MKNKSVQKLSIAGVFCALAVVGSMFLTFPVFGSKCAPVQHMVNILCAVFLGPWYGLAAAFVASLLRNLLGWGSLLAFPGSMCGALLCGLAYRMTKNLPATLAAEVLGTGVLGGLAAYPVAKELMGLTPETYTVYIIPFLISTAAGSILAGLLVYALRKNGALNAMRSALER